MRGRFSKQNACNGSLISVVVPNFNNAPYLHACLNSILSQAHENIELILVDDGSSDNSLEIIRSFSDKRIQLLALEKNVGVSAARNIGITSASGDYLTTLDSDDVLCSQEKLEQELKLISLHEDEGQDIVAFSNIVRLTETGQISSRVGNSSNIEEGFIFDGMLRRSIFIPRDFLCRRQIYQAVGGYDEYIEMYEDWDLKLRIAKKYPFYYTGLEGIGYRNRPGGLSQVAVEEHGRWMEYVRNKNGAA